MKRTKLVASLMMCVFCLSFLVVGVFAAVNVSFGLTGQLTFNPEGVYVKVSGQMYRGENYGTLAPLTAANYILPEMTNYDEVDGAPAGNLPMTSWTTPNVTLVPGERAVKYRIEVTNVSETGIKGTATATITGATGTPTVTTAGGVKTSVYTNCTVTEYAQYIQNIQPNDTQVYELVVELNQSATSATINVSISFDFTDNKMYQIEWKGNMYNYVNMGSYPQRYVGNTMNAELEAWYTTQTPVDSYTAYKGYTGRGTIYTQNDPVTYDSYNYIDGNTYVRVDIPEFLNTAYAYMNGETVINQASWFKVEPVQWRVLTNDYNSTGYAYLLSELALSANTTYYYDNTATQHESTSGYAGYKSSTIREFLTNSFYNETLTSEEQAKVTTRALTESELDPSSVITADTSVTDNVWLPTYTDYNTTYFSSNTQRLCSPSDFAIANYAGALVNTSSTTPARQDGCITSYWTSSAGSASNYAYYVGSKHVNFINVYNESYAVRPALLFKL